MRRGFGGRVLLASVATLLLTAATPAGLVSTRGLVQRLGRAGRATVAFRAVTRSEGGVRARRGTLALEPPDRVRIDFPALGERIALRSDGGEWVQPAARQMLTLTTQHVASTMGLWRLFLNPEEGLYAERRLTANRFRLGLDHGELDSGKRDLAESDRVRESCGRSRNLRVRRLAVRARAWRGWL